jgi:hypothetical protein
MEDYIGPLLIMDKEMFDNMHKEKIGHKTSESM